MRVYTSEKATSIPLLDRIVRKAWEALKDKSWRAFVWCGWLEKVTRARQRGDWIPAQTRNILVKKVFLDHDHFKRTKREASTSLPVALHLQQLALISDEGQTLQWVPDTTDVYHRSIFGSGAHSYSSGQLLGLKGFPLCCSPKASKVHGLLVCAFTHVHTHHPHTHPLYVLKQGKCFFC